MPDTAQTSSDAQGVLLTLDRGLSVLEEVARMEGEATAKGLSQALELNLGTCYQILKTLGVNGYVTKLPGNRFGLGSRVVFLTERYEAAASPPPELMRILRELHGDLEESVYVSLRVGRRIEIAAYLEGTKAVRVGGMRVGMSGHPHARASGRCFLAHVAEEEVRAWLSEDDLVPLTPNTITDWQDLLDDLEATRQRGYAIEFEEFNQGVACISCILMARDGRPAGAISVSVPATSMGARRDALVERLLQAGLEGSNSLGYEGDYPPPHE